MTAIDDVETFIEDEISFHREHENPWYWKIIHRIFRKRLASDIVVNELGMILRYLRERKKEDK